MHLKGEEKISESKSEFLYLFVPSKMRCDNFYEHTTQLHDTKTEKY